MNARATAGLSCTHGARWLAVCHGGDVLIGRQAQIGSSSQPTGSDAALHGHGPCGGQVRRSHVSAAASPREGDKAPAWRAVGRRRAATAGKAALIKRSQRSRHTAARHLASLLGQMHRIGMQHAVSDMGNVRFARRLALRLQGKDASPVGVVQCVLFSLVSRRPHLDQMLCAEWPDDACDDGGQGATELIARTRAAVLRSAGRGTFWHG